jgi:hypothetical protein
MGLLKSLIRWFNRADAYDQASSMNSLLMGRKRTDEASKAMFNQLNAADEVPDEPKESLPDVELDRDTSQEALAKRQAAIEHERHQRAARDA